MNLPASLRASLLAVAALTALPSSAGAQTAVPNGREGEQRQDLPLVLNRAECEEGNGHVYDVGGLTGTLNVQLWASQTGTCTVDDRNTNMNCFKIGDTLTPQGPSIPDLIIEPTDLVSVFDNGAGTCASDVGATARVNVDVFFFEGLENDPNTAPFATVQIEVDLVGPPPPTMTGTSPSSTDSLRVLWGDNPNTGDLFGFAVFCDPPVASVTDTPDTTTTVASGVGGAQADMFWPQAGGGQGGVGGHGGAVGGAGGTMTTTVSTTATTTAASTTVATTAATTGAGGALGAVCDSNLPVGAVPTGDPCAEVNGASATAATVSGLDASIEYAFAVASVDQVGNYGPLTANAICATPEPTVDFFEAYREAGGLGGGGLCSCRTVGGPPLSSLGPFGFFAVLALAVARRRDREDA